MRTRSNKNHDDRLSPRALGTIIAEIGHGTGPKLRFFWILTHYVTFWYTHMIYQKLHISEADILQQKSDRSVEATGPLGTKKL